MRKCDVVESGQALAYVTDCTLATVCSLASLSRPPKHELNRQIDIAQTALDWMNMFGINYKSTRAADVMELGGSVEAWSKQFMKKA